MCLILLTILPQIGAEKSYPYIVAHRIPAIWISLVGQATNYPPGRFRLSTNLVVVRGHAPFEPPQVKVAFNIAPPALKGQVRVKRSK